MRVEEKMHMYPCSIDLMEAVRKLDYKNQYKICYAFYDEIIKYPQWDENEFCLFFDELYERINPEMLDEEILKIRQCVNEMDNALSEIDRYDPGTFYELADELAEFIKV